MKDIFLFVLLVFGSLSLHAQATLSTQGNDTFYKNCQSGYTVNVVLDENNVDAHDFVVRLISSDSTMTSTEQTVSFIENDPDKTKSTIFNTISSWPDGSVSLYLLENDNIIDSSLFVVKGDYTVQISGGADTLYYCQYDEVILTSPSDGELTWNDQVSGSEFSFTALADQIVILNGSNGSCEASDTVFISLLNYLSFDIQEDTTFLCLGDSVDVFLTTKFDSIALWDNTSGIVADNGNQKTLKPLSSQWYIASSTLAGCTVSDTLYLQVDSLPPTPLAQVPAKECFCPGEYVSFASRRLNEDDFPDVTYFWSPSTGAISNVNKQNLTVVTQDTTTYIRTTTNNACMQMDSISIIVPNPPVELNFTDSLVCPGQRVQIILKNHEIFDEIEWGPEEAGLSCKNCPDPFITVTQDVEVMVMVKQKECPFSASATLRIKQPEVLVVIPDTTVCPGSPVPVQVLNTERYSSFKWSPSAGLSCDDCTNPTATANSDQVFTITAEDSDGCQASGTFFYNVPDAADITITYTPNGEVEYGSTVRATANVSSSINVVTYTWTVNGKELDDNAASIDALMNEEDNVISVKITDSNGCMSEKSIQIKAKTSKPEFPNVFAPRQAGNDRFKPIIKSPNQTLQSLKIFNRWGQVVYNDNNPDGWDGGDAPSDTYVYVCEIAFPSGDTQVYKGEVTLLR